MSKPPQNIATVQNAAEARIEQVLINGNLSGLNESERLNYYKRVCETLGLNPLTKPFDYINLGGKLTLYARKDAADQLRSLRKVSIKITGRETIEGVYIVTAHAALPDGREDESTGAVPIQNLKGDNLANAMMKAETKAKRRATLSICGLGILDETELETIPELKRAGVYPEQPMENDGVIFPEDTYKIPFGTFKMRTIEEVVRIKGPKIFGDYVMRNDEKFTKKPESKPDQWDDFVQRATRYLADLESAPLDGKSQDQEEL